VNPVVIASESEAIQGGATSVNGPLPWVAQRSHAMTGARAWPADDQLLAVRKVSHDLVWPLR
jgi:hypothetical protein